MRASSRARYCARLKTSRRTDCRQMNAGAIPAPTSCASTTIDGCVPNMPTTRTISFSVIVWVSERKRRCNACTSANPKPIARTHQGTSRCEPLLVSPAASARSSTTAIAVIAPARSQSGTNDRVGASSERTCVGIRL